MPLTSGTKLGPYEIQSLLGAGGMGEVYRATDTRLDRIVAVKVLASHLSSSPELKQRMEREARAISALNHPHICHLYDIGSQNGADFLVMEFLQGETLAGRLSRGALPLAEVYRIGVAVAEALSSAHRQGIVHRDLKPGNIMLTPGGAKLMDFGLAKPIGTHANVATSGNAPSFTAVATLSGPSPLSPLTTAGTVVGTIQYMSPEQIEGKEADARSDIFAFGAVLYEMAAGKRPFEGKSQLSLASSILEKDPEPVSGTNPTVPAAFDHLVATCLQKNPDDRFQTAHDIKLQLQWIATDRPPSGRLTVPAPPQRRPKQLVWAAAICAAVIAGAFAGAIFYRPARPLRTIRAAMNPPPNTNLNLMGDFAGPPVLAPDGSSIAFTATDSQGKIMLWVRPMNSLDARAIPGTEGAIFPFWSPDGRSLGFFADTKLKTIDVNGSAAQEIANAPFGRGGAWGRKDVILFSGGTQQPLMQVNAAGGTPAPATKLDPGLHTSHRWPFFLPDGRHFLYIAINHDPGKAANNGIYYASADGLENRLLFRSDSNAIYAAGFVLFARGDQLMAQAFDPAHGRLMGATISVAKGMANDISTWHMDASASDDGTLVMGSGGTARWQLRWLDRKGNQVGIIADKLVNLGLARLSPQADRVAMQLDNGQADIWVLDVARGVRTRLTFGPVSNHFPIWSPDGKWIAYNSGRNGHSQIYRKLSDGSGNEELLLENEQEIVPNDWSRDGKHLIYSRCPPGGHCEVWTLPLEGERKPQLVIAHAAVSLTTNAHLSPDGRWLSYASDESGGTEVFVAAFGGGQGKWQVSANGGSQPQWSHDGKELFFLDQQFDLFAVPVRQTEGALQFGAAQKLIGTVASVAPVVFYDVAPDGKRFLMENVSQQASQSVTVVSNFTAELKKD